MVQCDGITELKMTMCIVNVMNLTAARSPNAIWKSVWDCVLSIPLKKVGLVIRTVVLFALFHWRNEDANTPPPPSVHLDFGVNLCGVDPIYSLVHIPYQVNPCCQG